MSGKLGGAVIGYGGMGHFHVEKMCEVRGIGLRGIYDIDPKRSSEAQSKGIHAYESREALLADPKIDLVTVATPNDFHKEIVIAALKAGKNVICEKPVSLDSEELEEMIAAAKQYDRLFTVHQNRRWDEDFLTIRKICESGTLGRVFRIESRVHGSRGIPAGWRECKRQGGGMLLDWGVHLIDQMLTMMRAIGAKPVSVYGTCTNVTNTECDDGFTALVRFDKGPEWVVEVGTNTFVQIPRWYAMGENGSAVIEDWACNGKIVRVHQRTENNVAPISAGAGLTRTMAPRNEKTIHTYQLHKVKADWSEYYKNVVATLNGRAEIVVKHDELRQSMKFIEAVFESFRTGNTIRF
ncbi:MAG: Gfo/Idh/MocA family oxidoreductase [Victivallaceae bacterium]|nr:Gfo/Idh/MocA family oxidoreductase [Victivallaceae bacterium]